MTGLFQAIGERGARAVRQTVLAFMGAGLVVLALGCASAALVDVLALSMPRYLALGAIAAVLLLAGGACLARAGAPSKAPAASSRAPAFAAASPVSPPDWRAALQLALVEDARNRPARAAALAALAGLILGAMEGLDQSDGHETE